MRQKVLALVLVESGLLSAAAAISWLTWSNLDPTYWPVVVIGLFMAGEISVVLVAHRL